VVQEAHDSDAAVRYGSRAEPDHCSLTYRGAQTAYTEPLFGEALGMFVSKTLAKLLGPSGRFEGQETAASGRCLGQEGEFCDDNKDGRRRDVRMVAMVVAGRLFHRPATRRRE